MGSRERLEAAFKLLAAASSALGDGLEPDELWRVFPAAIVPAFAEGCVLEELNGDQLKRKAGAFQDAAIASRLDGATTPQRQVLRSGRALFCQKPAGSEELSLIVVPIKERSRTVGVATFACSEARAYDELDVELAKALAWQLGVALDGARVRRECREALRQRDQRERYLRMVFHELPGVVWATDADLRFTYAAGRALSFAGVEVKRLIGTELYELLGTRDPADDAVVHHRAALGGTNQSFEYRFKNRWLSVLIEPLYGKSDQPVGCVGAALDVTDVKAAAEPLERSEYRLRQAQRVAHIGSFEWNVASDTVTCSEELHRIYGVEPGTLGDSLEKFTSKVHPDDLAMTRAAIADALRRHGPFAYEHRVFRSDGQLRVLRNQGDVVDDGPGKGVRVVGTCWDVTELSEANRARERSLALLQATIEATADGELVVDLHGKVVIYNQRFLRLWRIPPELAKRADDQALLSFVVDQVEDPDGFLASVSERYADLQLEAVDVIRFKDGRIFERYSRPQFLGGEVVGRVWSFSDITERERLLKNAVFLADASRLLVSLDAEQALEGVAHLSVPLFGQACAIDLLGDGGPRRLVTVSVDPARPITPTLHPAVLGGNSTRYTLGSQSFLGLPLLTKGHLVGAITFAALSHQSYGAADLELGEELARRAALAVDNGRLYRHAQEALSAREELLSVAAHEIRGPISAIHVSVQSLRKGNVSPAKLPRLLDVIDRQDRRLARFVEELLDLGGLQKGRMRLEYSQVNLSDVTRRSAATLSPELARSGSSLAVTAPGDVVGQWDEFRIQQVVTNLLSNAIKFGLGKPIEVVVEAHDGVATLTVTDHGIGIRPDAQELVFKPFERAVSTRHYGGLGLGLHIVKTVVDALGGSIHLSSRPGAGSTFTVELPQGALALGTAEGEPHAHLDS